MITKPGNNTAAPSWPEPYIHGNSVQLKNPYYKSSNVIRAMLHSDLLRETPPNTYWLLAPHGLYITMTSKWARWRLKSPASQLFTQPSIQAQINENDKSPHHWPLCGEVTGDRLILRTNGQLHGKCFQLMNPPQDMIGNDYSILTHHKPTGDSGTGATGVGIRTST